MNNELSGCGKSEVERVTRIEIMIKRVNNARSQLQKVIMNASKLSLVLTGGSFSEGTSCDKKENNAVGDFQRLNIAIDDLQDSIEMIDHAITHFSEGVYDE